MAKAFDNFTEEQLAIIRARIQRSIDDPRPSLSLDESRADCQAAAVLG